MSGITDEELTAFLDGEADPALAARIEAARQAGGDVAARLERLSFDRGALAGAFDDVLAHAPAPDLPEAEAAPWGRFAAMAAALVLALGVGWFAGQRPAEEGLSSWEAYAAAYHRLYVNETLAAATFTKDDLAGQLQRVSTSLGVDLAPEEFSVFGDATLKRAQVLGMDGTPIGHLAFSGADGTPYALCIAMDGARDGEAAGRMFGLSTHQVSRDGVTYLLIGGADAGATERVWSAVIARL